ncbi:DUF2125 domain-containing protein [Rhodobacteraceae bacterium GS-10]|uniref:DUF2125 domain-containing protein n=2 Tax=Thalassovita mangrovi TaxID=2692236 RepID=A0A6L8LNG9_9RHOB|nr:DUF2125 domain-containing protein [Thalassovita mangrovi]
MKHIATFKTPLMAALLLGAVPAFADVTPTDVWGDWKSQMAAFGYEITAKETLSGPDLNVSDLTMRVEIPEDGGSVTVAMPGMTFHDNGDGTVAIQLPAILPLDVHVEAEGDDPVDLKVNYTTTGLAMTASGAPDNMTYNYAAASMGMALAEIVAEGKSVDIGEASLTMNNVSGSSSTSGSDLKTRTQDFRADALFYTVDMANPDKAEERVTMKGQINGLSAKGTAAMPEGVDTEDMAAAMAAGFAVDGSFEYAGGQSEFAFAGDGENFSGSSASDSGKFAISMNADQIAYSVAATGTKLNMQSSDLPFPVEVALAETGFDIAIPVAQTEDPQEFRFAVKLGDFTMSDMIWGIFDPTGQLPRDPATVAFDLAGKVKVLANIFDPKTMESMTDAAPGELHALDINGLTVRAAGAELTGKGAFTFDNSDLQSFDGMPRPEGVLNLMLTGGNALLDTLVAMGFVPEDQANGTRMMMGMFAVPGDAPDTLTSTIEVNAEGHVMANGQRLK